jgi:hypothetical protein
MASGGISGAGLALATGGGILLWSGLSGATPISILKTVAGGKAPPPINVGSPLKLLEDALGSVFSGFTSSLGAGVQGGLSALTGVSYSATDLGTRIASSAASYVGKVPYKWGGADPSGWDCSGMATYVLHHACGLNLPSNTHTVTSEFYVWSGATTVPVSQAQPGDLICWLTHVAIAISPTECVGAENPSIGTTVGTFQNMGPGGETFIVRRVKPQGAATTTTTGAVNA